MDGNPRAYRKPPFFDTALNYVQLDMDRLLERAGRSPSKQKRETARYRPNQRSHDWRIFPGR